jgi:carbon monoxide dehydrogenase subunit G
VRVSGTRTVRAPAADIWAFLLTPDRLRGCLPGCERFEASGPDTFAAQLRLGIGFLKGTYQGTVRVTEQQPHATLGLAVEGSGMLGSLRAAGTVHFAETDGITQLRYDGQAEVGGRVGAMGERVISGTASKLIDLFFSCLASKVESGITRPE